MVAPAAWLPEREPTWIDVGVGLFALLWSAYTLHVLGTVAWPVVAIGFVATVVAAGPGAKSGVGRRIGSWFRRIGVVGRALAIVAFAAAVWTVRETVAPPQSAFASLGSGIMLGVAVAVLGQLLYVKTMAGSSGG